MAGTVHDWNENDFTEFEFKLKSIGIPDDSALYIFWMKEIGMQTTWGVFCNNWANFLYEDEGCILIIPELEKSLVLSNGLAWLGDRSASKT